MPAINTVCRDMLTSRPRGSFRGFFSQHFHLHSANEKVWKPAENSRHGGSITRFGPFLEYLNLSLGVAKKVSDSPLAFSITYRYCAEIPEEPLGTVPGLSQRKLGIYFVFSLKPCSRVY
jgi:hypothetical protein